MILAQLDHFPEAEQIINAASVIFADLNDSTRFLQAGVVHGNLLGRQQRYAEAENIFRDLLNIAVSSGDIETQARLHNNLGYCYVNLDDYTRANIHFSQAVAKFTDLGYASGAVLVGKGQFEAGCGRLRQARTAFTKLEMPGEAGLCALRIIEAMVERGETGEARDLADRVIDEFTAAVLDTRAIDAVIRLRKSLDADGATAEAVRTVHASVERLALDETAAS